MMLISLCVVGILSCRLIFLCDSASFITASPELTNAENDLLVKGFLNSRYIRLMRLILENVTWYEANEICQQQGFGALENTSHSSFRQSIISRALMENTTYVSTNISFWTGFYRENTIDNEWFSVSKMNECRSVDLDFDSDDAEYQCAVNRYDFPGKEPKLEMRNCSDTFPFVCRFRRNEETNFTKYTEYHFINTPIGASINIDITDFDTCLDKCKKAGFCVGFTYTQLTSQCQRVRADFGVQALEYEIFHVGPSVSHYTKMGIDVIMIHGSNYADELGEVDQYFHCSSLSDNTTESQENSNVSFSISTTTNLETTSASIATAETMITVTSETTSESATTRTSSAQSTTTETTQLTTSLISSPTETDGPKIFIGPTPTSLTAGSSSSSTTSTDSESRSSESSTNSVSSTIPFSTSTKQSTPTTILTATPKHYTKEITTSPASLTIDGNISTSASAITSTSEIDDTNTDCLCICDLCNMKNNTSLTEIEEIIKVIVQNLTIKRKETYNYKSTLECAEDNRTSARAMGFVAAIVMCFVFGPILISDIFKVIRHF